MSKPVRAVAPGTMVIQVSFDGETWMELVDGSITDYPYHRLVPSPPGGAGRVRCQNLVPNPANTPQNGEER